MAVTLFERICDATAPPVVVAEAGINHNGDMDAAHELVVAAAESGADAVKFQTHLPEHEMVRGGPTAGYVGEPLFDLLSRMAFTLEQHRELKKFATESGIQFLSTPFSREAADLLEQIDVPLFKVGSGEHTNFPLLEHIARKQRPMLLSTGMTTLDEVRGTVTRVRKFNRQIALLHCTSTYPTPYEDVRLGAIHLLQESFPDVPIGLSDHSEGIYTALGGVALGARIVEKHFTISRSWEGPDQSASIEPPELIELVRGARAIHAAIQQGDKTVLPGEVEVQEMARESVVALRDIEAGETLSPDNVWVKRPGTGIPAREYERVVGRRARGSIAKDALLRWEDIAGSDSAGAR